MKKIIQSLLSIIFILTLTVPVFAENAVPYSGTATITINAPVDFKETIKVTMIAMNFDGVVENDPRKMTDNFEIAPESGYNVTLENLKGGKWTVMFSWKNTKSEKHWNIEKFAYDFEIQEGENYWELPITRVEVIEREMDNRPFYLIIWDLIASIWINSGPVIICLVLVCIWYAWYKYKNFDKYEKK